MSDCPPPPPADKRDRKIARLEARVALLTRDRTALARQVRRLQRHVDELSLELEFLP